MSSGGDDDERREIARIASELRRYLEANEGAADTLPGIVHWWWQLQRYQTLTQQVERALSLLVSDGVVETKLLADGETLYFLRRKSVAAP